MQKKLPALGCCGLDCGLCPRYFTKGSSKCPGCCGDDFKNKHPSCSFITCCVKNRNLVVCAECIDFPCSKFERETGETDSFITHRMVIYNQNFIRKHGIAKFIEQQNKRIKVLEDMLEYYDDGNSKSFLCLAATLLPLETLNKSLRKAEHEVNERLISKDDLRSKAKIIKVILNQSASEDNIELKLRKAKK